MKAILLFGIIFLFGCATSTGVVSIGKDTYMVGKSTNLSASSSGLKADAFNDAHEFCAKQNKNIQIVSTNEKDMVLGRNMTTAEIQFMCLSEGDIELRRPKLQKQVDKVVNVNSNINAKSINTSSTDLYTELKKLKELKDSGIITQQEFDIEKKEILSKY